MAEKAANKDPWPLMDQFAACGLDAPAPHREGWVFKRARLFVHLCPKMACPVCREAEAVGWSTLRVTAEDIRTGVALDKVARLV